MTVRAFPMPRHTRPAGWEGPWCRWCGEAILTGKKARGWHDGRGDENDCLLAYYLHTRRPQQYAHVAARDGEVCCDCGRRPLKVLRGQESFIMGGFTRHGADWVDGTRFCHVEIKVDLEVEHEVPLWSIAHLDDDARRPYFGPTNLRLRGPCCHKPKTKAEARSRAKGNRMKAAHEGTKRKPKVRMKSRPFSGSRPFPKVHRPIQSRGFR